MIKGSSDAVSFDQIDGFIRSFFYLKCELNSHSHFIISGLPEALADQREYVEKAFFKRGTSRSIENIDLFLNYCLALGDRQSPMTMGELRQALLVPMSTATRIVDWLVEGAFVERLADPDDRRVVKVALTDKGREIYRALYEFAAKHVQRILSKFSEDERTALNTLMHKFAHILSEERTDNIPGTSQALH